LVPADARDALDVTLVRLASRADAPREPVFTITRRDSPDEVFLSVSRGADGYAIALTDVGTFLIAAGVISYTLEEGVSPLTLEQALVDQIVPRALHLFGLPSLHASAAWREDLGAIAFTGDSGAGKSTLCAAVAARGCIVSDDSLSLQVDGDAIVALPGYPSLRLWPDAAVQFAVDAPSLVRATPRVPKLRMTAPLVSGPVPLRTEIVLERHDERAPHLERLHGREAFLALQKQVHRLAPDDPTALAAEFKLLSDVISRVAVRRLRYRPDLGELESLVERIITAATT